MICFEELLNILESRGRDAKIYLRGETVGFYNHLTKKFKIMYEIPVSAMYGEDQWEAGYF